MKLCVRYVMHFPSYLGSGDLILSQKALVRCRGKQTHTHDTQIPSRFPKVLENHY